ncbi:MAG: glycine cleavage T C-terminal barrel domain-containing protein, partial [Pseudomonadota bacterium]
SVRANEPREILSILEVEADIADASGSEPIFTVDGKPAGKVSSGAYGYHVDKSLALAHLYAHAAEPGTEVDVFILGKPHRAKVLAEPPFDPRGERLRA